MTYIELFERENLLYQSCSPNYFDIVWTVPTPQVTPTSSYYSSLSGPPVQDVPERTWNCYRSKTRLITVRYRTIIFPVNQNTQILPMFSSSRFSISCKVSGKILGSFSSTIKVNDRHFSRSLSTRDFYKIVVLDALNHFLHSTLYCLFVFKVSC